MALRSPGTWKSAGPRSSAIAPRALNSRKSIASQTSASASAHGLPASRTARAASFVRASRISAAARTRIAARSAAGVRDQRPKPRWTEATAASTSAGVALGAREATRSGSAGSVETMASPLRRSSPIHRAASIGGRASSQARPSSSFWRSLARRSSRMGSLRNVGRSVTIAVLMDLLQTSPGSAAADDAVLAAMTRCVAEVLHVEHGDLPVLPHERPLDFLGEWLAGRNLDAVPVRDPEGYSRAGAWIGLVATDAAPLGWRPIVLFGGPSALILDPLAETWGPASPPILQGFVLAELDTRHRAAP